jgi:putative transposase
VDSNHIHRKSLRLPGYDYSQAACYFITICTHQRRQSLSRIQDSATVLTDLGKLAEQNWLMLPQWFSSVTLDAYVIMPNHIHGILLALAHSTDQLEAASLLSIIRAFKSSATREWHCQYNSAQPIWQRGFYDHVIRDERALYKIREYIAWNPAQWHLDHENSARSAINPFYAWLETQGRLKLP